MTNKQIYACLWFDGHAKAAADDYCSIFKNSKMISENPMVVKFMLNDTVFMALNGGPHYQFTPATSFVLECDTQADIDYYWEHLGKDGKIRQCGWLDDKYGVSWQIVPSILPQLMGNPATAQKVMQAFLQMTKFDIATLEEAAK